MRVRAFLLGTGLVLSLTILFGLSRYDHSKPTAVAQQASYFGLYYASSGMGDGTPQSGVKFCQMRNGLSPPVFCVTEN